MKTEYQILQELTRLENLNVNPEVDYLTRISALKWVLDAGEVGNVAPANACPQLCDVPAGKNRYGVDVGYFSKELKSLCKSLPDRTPEELHRYLLVLAKVIEPV